MSIVYFRHFENSPDIPETEPALKNASGDEEELDTDLETDRLLGHQRLDDGFYDEKVCNGISTISKYKYQINNYFSFRIGQSVKNHVRFFRRLYRNFHQLKNK